VKLVIVGDLHIPNNKSSFISSDSFTEIFNTFQLIKDTVYKNKPEYVIFLGDIFDVPNMITTSVVSIFSELLSTLTIDVPVIFLAGNHDLLDDDISDTKIGDYVVSVKSSLVAPFKNFNNVIVFDTPTVATVSDNLDIGFIPYSNNIVKNLSSITKKFTKGHRKLLLGHFDLQQSQYYQSSNKNFVSLEHIPSAKDLIKKHKYDMVLLGHIHEQIDYNIDGRLVKFIGSCRNINFSNTGESKGIYVLDTKTLELEYIENTFTCNYKIFRSFKDLKDYCTSNEPEKLSKTKIKFVYSSIAELKKVAKLKEFFKSIKFEKNMLSIDSDGNVLELNTNSFKEFAEMLHSNTLTKEKILDYSFQFIQPENKDTTLKVFNMLGRNQ
jgi:DNA repair exonuclease SbcCD nuclease subunit